MTAAGSSLEGPTARAQRRARWLRAVVALGLAATTAVPLVAVTSAPAEAAGRPGYCADSTGVTVVVDFQALGGGVVVRCAPAPLPGSGTGLDALVAAGIPLEGVRRWGDSFICRLDGRPAATTALPVTGKPDYREQCLDTPPAAAFWGYWYASNGGSWQYSSLGVKGHRAISGGFEGWSFSLNASGSGNPVPRLTPSRPATPAAAPTAPAAGSGASGPGGGSGATGGGSGSAAGGSGSTPSTGSTTAGQALTPGQAASTPGRTQPSVTPGTSSTSSTPGSDGTEGPATPSGTTTAAGSSAGAAPTEPPAVSGELAAAPAAATGTSTSTTVGVGVLAFLLVVGAGTAWRRRRGADSP